MLHQRKLALNTDARDSLYFSLSLSLSLSVSKLHKNLRNHHGKLMLAHERLRTHDHLVAVSVAAAEATQAEVGCLGKSKKAGVGCATMGADHKGQTWECGNLRMGV